MSASVTRKLIVAVTALGGISAGTTLDRSIVELPAWRRVGAVPWAAYSRQADLKNGLAWYAPLGFAMLIVNLVQGSGNTASVYTCSGRPLYVHLNGLAQVVLKYSMNASTRSLRSSTDLKLPRLSSLRTRMLNHSSI